MYDAQVTQAKKSPENVRSDVRKSEHSRTLAPMPDNAAETQKTGASIDISSDPGTTEPIGVRMTKGERSYANKWDALREDCRTRKDAELPKLYRAEHTSWRAMLDRENKGMRLVADEFRDFRSYLVHVGPQPKLGYTVDRIDNDNKTYGPGLVRWASKTTQNRNRSNALEFKHSKNGKVYDTAALSAKHHVAPSTVRRRHHDGWTADEQIAGKRLPASAAKFQKPAATSLLPLWEQLLEDAFPADCATLTPTEKKQLGQFEEYCRDARAQPEDVLRCVVEDWWGFGERAEAEYGQPDQTAPTVPQPWFLLKRARSAVTHFLQSEIAAAENANAALDLAIGLGARSHLSNVELLRLEYETDREENCGIAPLPPTVPEWNEIFADEPEHQFSDDVIPANCIRVWRRHRPYIRMEHLSPAQINWYPRVDPEWFASQAATSGTKSEAPSDTDDALDLNL